MRKKLLKIMLVFLVILPLGLTYAQLKSQIKEAPSVEKSIRVPGIGSSSLGLNLFDPNRFNINHSYSLSFMNMGNNPVSMGIYQNQMSYIFSENLILNAKLGFIHNPLQMGMNQRQTNLFDNLIYGAELMYRPKENVILNIEFDSYPSLYRYGLSPYNYRYYPLP